MLCTQTKTFTWPCYNEMITPESYTGMVQWAIQIDDHHHRTCFNQVKHMNQKLICKWKGKDIQMETLN